MKKTLYEILEVSPDATDADIRDAYQRLSQRLESGESGLDHAEASFQLTLLKQAFWTLSDNMQRLAYDASLAKPAIEPREVEVREVEVRVRNKSRLVPARILVSVIGGLFALGILTQIAYSVMSHNRGPGAASLAEKKVVLKEFEMVYGVSSPDEIAAVRIREEQERAKAETRRQEYASKEAARQQERELRQNRYYAEQVSRELRLAEEQAQREAEYEKRKAEERELARRQEEQYRQEEQRRRWQQQIKN